MEALFSPEVIEAASTSKLGVLSLMVIVIGSLSFFFFRDSPHRVKLTVFLVLFLGVVGYGTSIQVAYVQDTGEEFPEITQSETKLPDSGTTSGVEKKPAVRTEAVELSVAAGLGGFPSCKTVTKTGEKFGEGPKDEEKLASPPTCETVSAEVEDRAKILDCGTKNEKPYMRVEVSGKGCEFSNKATFLMTATYVEAG